MGASPAERHQESEIAIIGMSGRFPGSSNLGSFWRNLREGVESISFFSKSELKRAGVAPELFNDPHYVPARGILKDIDRFDASFFGFSPREAEIMDPQHRLFLECAWEALEGAGYHPERDAGPIGVFAGSKLNQYALAQLNETGAQALDEIGIRIGNSKDFLPTQVSYKLNLMGPSINVQTACSTSLVAVHLACQSLLGGECDLALAGGVAITVPQKTGYLYQDGGIASPDGHCRAFDAKARGTVGGNGAGIVVLKRLEEALADGDVVHAVVRGSAINNDGSAKVGYTAPSVDGQAAVIEEALAAAGVPPETISYVETHGTGTRLGDPIEIAALTEAFSTADRRRGFCALGSLKTNVGHLDPAAGVAGLIKTVLALKHREIPPSLHFEEPNPDIDFASGSFYVNTVLQPWSRGATPRRAGVSSFGIGGTNSHVVLEEAPAIEPSGESRSRQLLVLSAKTASALESSTANLAAHLRETAAAGGPDTDLADLAYTLQVGRGEFEHRRMLIVRDGDDARAGLEAPDPRRVFTRCQKSGDRPVVFMFPGQGAQYVNMGRELTEEEPTFRTQLDHCAELLAPALGSDLRQLLYPPAGDQEAAAARLKQTSFTQPALFAVEYALAKLWMEWGVRPEAMIGHSIGEYVAACLAGVFSLEDGLALVALRARLIQELPEGAMLSVPLPAAELRPLLARSESDGVCLAAINAPSLCVVSGPTAAVDALAGELAEQGTRCRRLEVSHAFHSSAIEPVLGPFAEKLAEIDLRPPNMPYLSNVTGSWITAAAATDPSYWVRHLRDPVRFADGVARLLKDPEAIFLEVGPGRGLGALVRRQAGRDDPRAVLSSLSSSGDGPNASEYLLTTMGKLWLAGFPVNWQAFHARERRSRVPLPTYPFERRRYWIEPQAPAPGIRPVPESTGPQRPAPEPADAEGPIAKRPDLSDWIYIPCWRRTQPASRLAKPEAGASPAGRGPWLLFMDGEGLGLRMVERLSQEGCRIVTVTPGDAFSRRDGDRFTLRPAVSEDYQALLDELEAQGVIPERIAHLWTVNGEADSPGCLVQDLGFFSLLFLGQALAARGWDHPLRLDVVSTGVHEVTGEEESNPMKATLLGPVRVLPQEDPHVTCRAIDVVLEQSHRPERLADLILAELAAGSPDPVVALRGKHRWVPSFDQARLPVAGEPAARLREEGVYLITGGLGGIGLALAEYLGRTLRAKLILVSRSAFPEPDGWPGWLEHHDAEDEVSRKIRRLQALRDAGAEVMVACADVSERDPMAAVVERARQRFGRIHGVVHAAGVAGGGLIEHKTHEMVAEVFAPKITGARVLESIFGSATTQGAEPGAALDFLVFFSSISSLAGGPGRVDYAAANAFLDALALRNALSDETFTASIAWDAWQEVGMAAAEAKCSDLKGFWQTHLEHAILPAEGIEVLLRVLGGDLPQVIISTRDLQAVLKRCRIRLGDLLAGLEQESDRAVHSRPDLTTSYVPPANDLERSIARSWQEVLGLDRVGIHDDFFELGGQSLVATQILSRLRRSHEVEISMQQFFAATTVAELAVAVAAAGQEEASEMASNITFNDRVKGRL
ncbi:MAG: SDR family NAD(P)-dependent oxidoreductase [bacterium]|nr:SDR family NAD(P)-dependent oxidoreductase [bacterium]